MALKCGIVVESLYGLWVMGTTSAYAREGTVEIVVGRASLYHNFCVLEVPKMALRVPE